MAGGTTVGGMKGGTMAGHAIAAAVEADRRRGALAPDLPHTAGETGELMFSQNNCDQKQGQPSDFRSALKSLLTGDPSPVVLQS